MPHTALQRPPWPSEGAQPRGLFHPAVGAPHPGTVSAWQFVAEEGFWGGMGAVLRCHEPLSSAWWYMWGTATLAPHHLTTGACRALIVPTEVPLLCQCQSHPSHPLSNLCTSLRYGVGEDRRLLLVPMGPSSCLRLPELPQARSVSHVG